MDLQALKRLKKKVQEYPNTNYPVHSRTHPLHSFCTNVNATCFVKRDDELGFGISGNKLRKFRSLVPYLIAQDCKEAIILGGPFSNNVLSLTQLLLENHIKPTLFLRGSEPPLSKGNFLLLQMLMPTSSMHWIPRKLWPEIDLCISSYTTNRKNYFVVPEGSATFPALPGALTLPLDIIQNEEELNTSFDHIFIDAGTGFSAGALLLGFSFLKKNTKCHLLLLADEEKDFLLRLNNLHKEFEEWLGEKCPIPTLFTCSKSELTFGATNNSIFKFLVETARDEGIFLDPVYSGKLFFHAKKIIQEEKISGKILLIHSGGALTLTGFIEEIKSAVSSVKNEGF